MDLFILVAGSKIEIHAEHHPRFKIRRVFCQARQCHNIKVGVVRGQPLEAGAEKEFVLGIAPGFLGGFVDIFGLHADAEFLVHQSP